MVNFLLGHIIDVTIFYCRGKYPSIFCHIVFKIYCIKILKGSNYHHHPYLSHSTFQTDNHQKGLKCIFWYKLLTATSICSHKLNEFVLTKNCLDKILTFQSGYWKMKWFQIHMPASHRNLIEIFENRKHIDLLWSSKLIFLTKYLNILTIVLSRVMIWYFIL